MLLGFATLFSPTNWRIEIFNFLQPKYYTIMLEPLLCDVIYQVLFLLFLFSARMFHNTQRDRERKKERELKGTVSRDFRHFFRSNTPPGIHMSKQIYGVGVVVDHADTVSAQYITNSNNLKMWNPLPKERFSNLRPTTVSSQKLKSFQNRFCLLI